MLKPVIGLECRVCWALDVSRIASNEITLVLLSVCPSVCPSLSFLKIVSLVFPDVVHDDS